jgi:hypothetical protein
MLCWKDFLLFTLFVLGKLIKVDWGARDDLAVNCSQHAFNVHSPQMNGTSDGFVCSVLQLRRAYEGLEGMKFER